MDNSPKQVWSNLGSPTLPRSWALGPRACGGEGWASPRGTPRPWPTLPSHLAPFVNVSPGLPTGQEPGSGRGGGLLGRSRGAQGAQVRVRGEANFVAPPCSRRRRAAERRKAALHSGPGPAGTRRPLSGPSAALALHDGCSQSRGSSAGPARTSRAQSREPVLARASGSPPRAGEAQPSPLLLGDGARLFSPRLPGRPLFPAEAAGGARGGDPASASASLRCSPEPAGSPARLAPLPAPPPQTLSGSLPAPGGSGCVPELQPLWHSAPSLPFGQFSLRKTSQAYSFIFSAGHTHSLQAWALSEGSGDASMQPPPSPRLPPGSLCSSALSLRTSCALAALPH
ncbi:PREDICTED: large proline-rich protein BAG6-like isoform X2 [Chinchilla lanigera]|uniref:large proline-rich protein BAG6-like isoform X2 n=1 Tax=Chinchilla lanigera TaxID=34839 RepID=UPI00038E9B31|nr:PREDICTED: large proline-rich protein BAG6-like isoform X2 [Chinchilla lanigera]